MLTLYGYVISQTKIKLFLLQKIIKKRDKKLKMTILLSLNYATVKFKEHALNIREDASLWLSYRSRCKIATKIVINFDL